MNSSFRILHRLFTSKPSSSSLSPSSLLHSTTRSSCYIPHREYSTPSIYRSHCCQHGNPPPVYPNKKSSLVNYNASLSPSSPNSRHGWLIHSPLQTKTNQRHPPCYSSSLSNYHSYHLHHNHSSSPPHRMFWTGSPDNTKTPHSPSSSSSSSSSKKADTDATDSPPPPSGGILSMFSPQRLRWLTMQYGRAAVGTYIALDVISISSFYAAIKFGCDLNTLLKSVGIDEMLGALEDSWVFEHAGTFVIAFAAHKIFFPVRVGLCVVLTPYLVRKLRSFGLIQTPKPVMKTSFAQIRMNIKNERKKKFAELRKELRERRAQARKAAGED